MRVFWVFSGDQLGRWTSVALLLGVLAVGLRFGTTAPLAPVITQAAVTPLTRAQPIFAAPGAKGLMAFAINIDWGEEYLPGMLKVLQATDSTATFFPTGNWARKFPDLVAQIAADGFELGNHGASHAHPKQLGNAQLAQLITDGAGIMADLSGQKPALFAPPYGEYDQRITKVAADLGYYTTMWTLDTIDWQKPSPETILNRIVPRAKDGAIVLMHPTASTLAALPQMIRALNAKGYKIVSVSRLIAAHQEAAGAGANA